MAITKGKQFEQKFKGDIAKISGSFCHRLPDQFNGYKNTSKNPCDFFVYMYPLFFMSEVKSTQGNTFYIKNFTQLDKMKDFVGIPGLRSGVIIWFIDHFRVLYVPTRTIQQMIQDGKKSVNIRTIETDGYDYLEIPSVKRRVFLDSDYTVLQSLPETW